MKANVVKSNLIELVPENDSDAALLALWSERVARVASSKYSNGETLAVLIEFRERKNSIIEEVEKQVGDGKGVEAEVVRCNG